MTKFTFLIQLVILTSIIVSMPKKLQSQIVTVEVSDFFYYTQQPESYSFYIVEELSYLQFTRMDDETRDSEFSKRVKELHNFLDKNNLRYQLKPLSPVIKENQLKRKMVLKRHDLIISNGSNTRELIKIFVNDQKGILYRHHPLENPLEDEFMKSCMNKLESKAREEAEPYAKTQNKTCGEVHEIKIVKQITNTKQENNQSISDEYKTATHIAHFTLEISFKTVNSE